ncbi:MAG: His/Gly/Thr/Pro-type tRNA ligase C-terminal domain-containing protein, partial [Patescibacteria group bacterium]
DAYCEDKDRVVLKLKPSLAPYKVAVFPLLKNKPELVEKAKEVYNMLKKEFNVAFDDRGNIGKRYYSQDEIGTPFCVTIDFDTLKNDTVTVRDRDTMKQERVKVSELAKVITERLKD